MLIYILNFLSIPIYALFIKNRKHFVTLMTVQLFLILAFRAPTLGVDLPNYSGGYDFISTLSFGQMLSRLRLLSTADLYYLYSYESGYVFINWIISFFKADFHWFLVCHAAFCMISFGIFIYRYSDCPWLSFCLFTALGFYIYAFGILRQMLAIAILLYSIPSIIDRKAGRFFLIVLAAFTVHRVSIIFIPLYFVAGLKADRRRMGLVGLGVVLFFLMSNIIYDRLVIPILNLIGKSGYIKISEFELNKQIIIMLIIFICIYFFANFKEMFPKDGINKNNIFFWGYIVSIAVELIGLYNEVVARAVDVYFIMAIILIPNILENYPELKVKNISKVMIYAISFVFMIYQLSNSAIVPYVSIYEHNLVIR